jgi:GT2 family glycosyltransferase
VGHQQPFTSVIVPTYNRQAQLAACLESLARLDYPRDRFEVIVVDDGSVAPLEAVVAPFEDRFGLALVKQPHAGAAAARNTGAARAKGEFLAFTDDDCAPASDWLRALAARFAATPDHAIGGRTVNALSDNLYSTTSQSIIDVVYAYYNADAGRARFFASGNLAVPAKGFHAVGGFDPAFRTSEDRDLCDRWLQRGYRMTYAPEAVVYHAHALTLRTFWWQHFGYGRGAFRFHRVDVRRFLVRFRPDVRFYLAVFRRPFSEPEIRRVLAMAGLLLVWQAANAAGFLWEGFSRLAKTMKWR